MNKIKGMLWTFFTQNPKFYKDRLFWVFLACLTYWTFLLFTSRMHIQYDAIGYESLGKMLLNQGWLEYFRTGPNREPGYPFLILISMSLAKTFTLFYQQIQALLQLLLLFITQLLMLRILRALKIRDTLTALAVLYLGISPAIVNSALSLFSEITTYPLILASLLFFYRGWLSLAGPRRRIIAFAACAGASLAALTLCKGIFEVVSLVLILAFVSAGLSTREPKTIKNALLYAAVLITMFTVPLFCFKSTNKAFNGQWTLTNRGDWMLYGSAARRAEPLTKERFLTALAFIPGDGFCQAIFGQEKCSYWSFMTTDGLGLDKRNELARTIKDPQELSRSLLRLSVATALQHPGQFVLLAVTEGTKMFFWESTQIGFVSYHPGLNKLFRWTPFKNSLRFSFALLTICGFLHLIIHLWQRRKTLFAAPGPACAGENILLFFIFVFIFSFIGLYALFSILTRYALPIAPLFLIAIAFMANSFFLKKPYPKRHRKS